MRRSLGFVDTAPDPRKRCGLCVFFTSTSGDCGKCQLLSGGPVPATGHCDSWAAKG
ncbi:MAG TPA: high-potential iron-sulfur protein [Novosphingobium sp.]